MIRMTPDEEGRPEGIRAKFQGYLSLGASEQPVAVSGESLGAEAPLRSQTPHC